MLTCFMSIAGGVSWGEVLPPLRSAGAPVVAGPPNDGDLRVPPRSGGTTAAHGPSPGFPQKRHVFCFMVLRATGTIGSISRSWNSEPQQQRRW